MTDRLPWLLPLALAAALLHPARVAAAETADQAPTFYGDDKTTHATDDLQWSVPMHIQNPTGRGLYLDSLFLDVADHDAARIHGPATTRTNLTFLLQLHPSLSGGEDGYFQYSGPAATEHATLTFTLLMHDQQGHHWTRTITEEVLPGAYSDSHPSEFVRAGGRKVELVRVAPDSSHGGGMVLIHGEGSDARRLMSVARALAAHGFHVVLVSLPGYGGSDGPADFAGPASVAAASAALDALAATPGVDRARLIVWGISRGATVAMLLAAQRHDVAGVIAQSGIYDPWATWRADARGAIGQAIAAEAGSDSAAWRARAPLLAAAKVKAAVFIAHGDKDADVPVAQAHGLAAALRAQGVAVEDKYVPNGTHALNPAMVQRPALEFLARTLNR
ncbi:MAG TPA: alpha/beta fold hydrolase [Candidatus Eisenbacteria bacterium]|nr:alpha/beta fold hydrolase [Candidatus Eisenbacteria bacterium]